MHYKKLMKMNLQKFAEGGADGGSVDTTVTEAQTDGGGEPTEAELLARIAQLEAENAQRTADAQKWKNASDKASADAANYKRQLTAKQTAQEQAETAKAEAEQAKDQRIADMEQKIAQLEREKLLSDRTAFYMSEGVGVEAETAKAMATAQVDGDWSKFDKALVAHIKSVKDATRVAVLGERGVAHAGNGDDDNDPAVAILGNIGSYTNGKKQADVFGYYTK